MPPKAKDAVLAMAVLANVILLCALLAYAVRLPRADAQAAPGASSQKSLAVSGLIDAGGVNAVYLIDPNQQRLYVWVPARVANTVSMSLRDVRDLRADFARQSPPAIPPRTR